MGDPDASPFTAANGGGRGGAMSAPVPGAGAPEDDDMDPMARRGSL